VAAARLVGTIGAILLAGCGPDPAQNRPLDPADRATLEHERVVVADRYAELVRRQTELEGRNLDARQRSTEQKLAGLQKDLAKIDVTLAAVDKQRKELVGQMELGGVGPASKPGGIGSEKEWADQVAGLNAMRSQAELDRVGVQSRLAAAEDEMASVRQNLALRDILARESIVLEKRLIELNRALKGKP
jgi:hypothetical protein